MSSGRRRISSRAGRTATPRVYRPRDIHATRQSQATMIRCATKGIRANPVPWEPFSRPRAAGRRRMNQLLTAVEVPSSRGLAKDILPTRYRSRNAHDWVT